MTIEQRKQLKEWVENWARAGAELENIRNKEIRDADTQKAIKSLDSAFKSAILLYPPKHNSGLVEMQKIFSRIKSC